MAAGRRREAWYHTALLVSCWAGEKHDETDFHPEGRDAYAQPEAAPPPTESDREMLRAAFPGKQE